MAAMAEQLLTKSFTNWCEEVKSTEANFKKYVYDNQEMGELDLRQHRLWLHNLLCTGEAMLVNFQVFQSMTSNEDAFQEETTLIEQKKKELFATLIEWHGPIEAQTDLPADLKQAMREIAAGQIEDMPEL